MSDNYLRVKSQRKTISGYVLESQWTHADTVYNSDGTTASKTYSDIINHKNNTNIHLTEGKKDVLEKFTTDSDGNLYFDGKKINFYSSSSGGSSGGSLDGEITTYQQLIEDMGAGYNYGNTYEAFVNQVDGVDVPIKTPVTYTGATTSPNLQSTSSHTSSWQLQSHLYSSDGSGDWVATDGNAWANSQGVIQLEWDTSTTTKNGQNLTSLGFQVFSRKNDKIDNGITTGTMNLTLKLWYDNVAVLTKDYTLSCTEETAYDGGKMYKSEVISLSASDFNATVKVGKVVKAQVTIHTYPDILISSVDPLDVNDNQTYTLWGNAKMNPLAISMLKAKGFKTVRLPVSWGNHTNHDGKIDDEWFTEVKYAVDTIINAGMYCIINLHGDTMELGWLLANYERIAEMKAKLSGIWIQIANYFKNYNDHLLFEGFNEVLAENSAGTRMWSDYEMNATERINCYKAIGELNQSFIDTVRGTGGNNPSRWLICSSYACNWQGTLENGIDHSMINRYVIPTDIKNRMLVQFHVYRNLENSIEALEAIHDRFSEEDLGVIIGEYGARADAATTSTRETYAYGFSKKCHELGMHCDWWDDGGFNQVNIDQVNNFGILGKGDYIVWIFEGIADSIINGWNDGQQ